MVFWTRLVYILWLIVATAKAGGETTRPVWLVSNGFHSSLGFRAADFPNAKNLTGDSQPDILLIGWGATRFYEGHNDPISLFRAIFGLDSSALHVVPVRGRLNLHWSHSDIVRIELPVGRHRELVREIAQSFARDSAGHLRLLGRGYFPDSRFYLSRDHFFFPKMCNLWVAQKLQHAGLSLHGPILLMASPLVLRALPAGRREGVLRNPVDNF